MMKFTFKKLTTQEMVDRGIDKNLYLTDKKNVYLYTFTGILAIVIIGTLLFMDNPNLIANIYN